ncbi:GNAT family N-acetyltransferase [Paenisporosarcina cavernae]|uniref:GNAT family N-acetyltransferase n=1 Tax=Paenisporosarcina cavernae TaxID=2320858 RepID=A0A385YV19_9BACL|nr:GNAT family protein [Paenisporosarcina cavernae]AYC30394.1 GNAT family N-acetyltransferase [Paenisporosarcina cavernae]
MKLQEWTMEEQELLIHFMTTNNWPFHGNSTPAREIIEKTIEEGGYESDEVKTFWLEEDSQKVGMVKLFDLQDDIPVFDLRIAEAFRGKGYGPQALKLIATYVFSLPENKIRIEGHTRQDNFAMRKTFERAGFVKEAHLRKSWYSPKEDKLYDSITYGMTREDFLSGKTTPVIWNDENPYVVEVQEATSIQPVLINKELHSKRLSMHSPRSEDSRDVWESISTSIEQLKPWLRFAQDPPTLDQTERNIREAATLFEQQKQLRFHLFEKDSSTFIGTVDFYEIDWEVKKMSIHYWLDYRFEGKGYMTEAVDFLSRIAFEDWGIRRLALRCETDNVRSRAVAERLGFTLEGILRGDALSADRTHITDMCIYAKIKE